MLASQVCNKVQKCMPDPVSESLRELSEFALAWSEKYDKCFVGLSVDPAYADDPAQPLQASPTIITTVPMEVLPLIFRRAQFSVCANMVEDTQQLLDIMKASTKAADSQSADHLVQAATEMVRKNEEAKDGVVRRPVPGTPFSVIDGGLASAEASVDGEPPPAGPFAPPPSPPPNAS